MVVTDMQVRGKWPKKFFLEDPNGNMVLMLKNRSIFTGGYTVSTPDQTIVASCFQQTSFTLKKYVLKVASGDVMLVRGRYLRRDFEFYDKKSGAIYVEAEKAIIRDRFKIRIQPGVDIALMICMCVMIGNQQ